MKGKTHRREVRYAKCGWWWHHPREPIHFASWDEWAEGHQEKETLACPNCGERTEVSEGMVRFTKVSGETFAPPGVSREAPGFTELGKPEEGKPGKKKR